MALCGLAFEGRPPRGNDLVVERLSRHEPELGLARLQAKGIISPNDTRLLLDRAILTLENMLFQDEAVRKARVALESLFVLPGVGKEVREVRIVPAPSVKWIEGRRLRGRIKSQTRRPRHASLLRSWPQRHL